jgi:hypothetical protein
VFEALQEIELAHPFGLCDRSKPPAISKEVRRERERERERHRERPIERQEERERDLGTERGDIERHRRVSSCFLHRAN